jgi:hypothetical protein
MDLWPHIQRHTVIVIIIIINVIILQVTDYDRHFCIFIVILC